jgi:hypothetical protein
MLMRRAVAVVRQWHPLAGRALAGAGPALQRIPVDVEPVQGLVGEKLVRELQVALDHAEYPALGVQREIRADVVEQRPCRPRKIMAVGRQPLDCGLARP